MKCVDSKTYNHLFCTANMITAIIQARMGSTRLPGKVMMLIRNKPVLHYVVKQTLAAKLIDNVIIATTRSPDDNAIVNFCKKNNLKYFRGSEIDVLSRYYHCAKKFNCKIIVRITSDCPLIDPTIIDSAIKKFVKKSYDYLSNDMEKTYNKWKDSACGFPQGMYVGIVNYKTLKKIYNHAKHSYEREHVFPYVQYNPKSFKISNIKNKINLSYIRCTIDRKEDIKFIRKIYDKISNTKKPIYVKNIVKIIKKEPSLLTINNKINYDEGWKNSRTEYMKNIFD